MFIPTIGFGRPEIDAVMIHTSTDTMLQIIIEAAEAGKHIFCEKPMILMLTHISSPGCCMSMVKITIGFNRRFDQLQESSGALKGEVESPHNKDHIQDPAPPPN